MTVRTTTLALLAVLATPLIGRAPVPRNSPELKFIDTSGKEILLSNFTGKVVLVEFLLTNCPHCIGLAQTINRLNHKLARPDFQAIAIAFDDGPSGPTVADFAREFSITLLAGHTSSSKVDTYLGRNPGERFQVPQIVVIDRNGVIRAQSQPVGEKALEDEAHLRSLIDSLLDEGYSSWTSGASAFSLAVAAVLGGALIWIRRQKWQKSAAPQQRLAR